MINIRKTVTTEVEVDVEVEISPLELEATDLIQALAGRELTTTELREIAKIINGQGAPQFRCIELNTLADVLTYEQVSRQFTRFSPQTIQL